LLDNGDAYNEEVSETFLLFGDPAMALKVPLPRRPAGLMAEQTGNVVVSLSWQAAADADGNAAAGYNVYRSTSASGGYSRIKTDPVTGTAYADETVAVGTRYYYTVASVDDAGDESVNSQSVSIVPTAAIRVLSGSGGGGGGGGCFITSAAEYSIPLKNSLIAVLLGIILMIGMMSAVKHGRI